MEGGEYKLAIMYDETDKFSFKKQLVETICNIDNVTAYLSEEDIIIKSIDCEYTLRTERESTRMNYLEIFFRKFGLSSSPLSKVAWILAKDTNIAPYLGMSAIEILYALYDVTAYKVAKNSDIPKLTIYKASGKDVYRLSVKVLCGIAICLNEPPEKILGRLLMIQKAFDEKQEEF